MAGAPGKFGTLPLADLLAPAIHYANEGFPVSEMTAGHWAASVGICSAEPNAAATFLIEGRRPSRRRSSATPISRGPCPASPSKAGTVSTRAYRRGHRRTLAERRRPDDADDLSEFEAEWVQPISTTYRGWTV